MNQRKEENDRRNYFMINLHESMGPGRDRTRDPLICSQTRICCQTRYRMRYAARYLSILIHFVISLPNAHHVINTHYYNSNLIWRTVSRRMDEVIPSRSVEGDPMVWPYPRDVILYARSSFTFIIICLLYTFL